MQNQCSSFQKVGCVVFMVSAIAGSACARGVEVQIAKPPEVKWTLEKGQQLESGPIHAQVFSLESPGKIVVRAGQVLITCRGEEGARKIVEGEHEIRDGCVAEVLSGSSCAVVIGKAITEVQAPTNASSVWLKFTKSS